MRTLADILVRVKSPENISELLIPPYQGTIGRGVMLAVEDMRRHMTDEGWQIAHGLEHAGYALTGFNLPIPLTDTRAILAELAPGVVVVQDKREWDVDEEDFREKRARFTNVEELASQTDVFKLTILKDAQARPEYHRDSAQEIGCHAWIVYYHPVIVKHVAPYVRIQHLVRTYHSLDSKLVPDFNYDRRKCFLSGAVSGAYPLRRKLAIDCALLYHTEFLSHPGYHRDGCTTARYLETLNRFKVAICTSSIYGYALRKIIEATACGCRVITDLPVEEVLPHIDNNLIRVSSEISIPEINTVIQKALESYCYEEQKEYATWAKSWYDYGAVGKRLAQDIETIRTNYAYV